MFNKWLHVKRENSRSLVCYERGASGTGRLGIVTGRGEADSVGVPCGSLSW